MTGKYVGVTRLHCSYRLVCNIAVTTCRFRFDGFLCLMSLAGGTGSGLGTYITEMLRDNYNKQFIINQVVSPYQSGEVIVQNYNSLLTLAHLHEVRG